MINIYFDGATGGVNPSDLIGFGVLYDDLEFRGKVTSTKKDLSNNLAEYYGFDFCLDLIEIRKPNVPITIYGDSKMVVNQMNGEWRIKEGVYTDLAKISKDKLEKLKETYDITIQWIRRSKNDEADRLSKEALLINK